MLPDLFQMPWIFTCRLYTAPRCCFCVALDSGSHALLPETNSEDGQHQRYTKVSFALPLMCRNLFSFPLTQRAQVQHCQCWFGFREGTFASSFFIRLQVRCLLPLHDVTKFATSMRMSILMRARELNACAASVAVDYRAWHDLILTRALRNPQSPAQLEWAMWNSGSSYCTARTCSTLVVRLIGSVQQRLSIVVTTPSCCLCWRNTSALLCILSSTQTWYSLRT